MKVFSIYDSKAKAFKTPLYGVTTGEFLREFQDAVNDEKSYLNRHPSDYCLFEVAEFDPHTGTFTPTTPHTNLGLASQYLIEKPSWNDGLVSKKSELTSVSAPN